MPAPQSVHENDVVPGSYAVLGAAGSYDWTWKSRFELGKRMPRISCAMLPGGFADVMASAAGPGAPATGAVRAGPTTVICFSRTSPPSSADPAGNAFLFKR